MKAVSDDETNEFLTQLNILREVRKSIQNQVDVLTRYKGWVIIQEESLAKGKVPDSWAYSDDRKKDSEYINISISFGKLRNLDFFRTGARLKVNRFDINGGFPDDEININSLAPLQAPCHFSEIRELSLSELANFSMKGDFFKILKKLVILRIHSCPLVNEIWSIGPNLE